MAKRIRDTIIDVSGVDVDSRGKVRNPDKDEDGRKSTGLKARKKNTKKDQLEKVAASLDEPKKKKRRKVVEEVEAPVKKKKRSKELVPASNKQLAKLERRRERAMGDLQLIQASPDTSDEFDRQYRDMFEKLQHIIGKFEDNMMENPTGRDVYALSTLYSQMREVIADIRASKDVTQQIVELESRAYSGFLRSIGQSYVDIYFKLQKDIRMFVKDIDAQEQLLTSLKGVCKDQADNAQASYGQMLDQVRTVLM